MNGAGYIVEIHEFGRGSTMITIRHPDGGEPMRLYGYFASGSQAKSAIEYFLECVKAGRYEIRDPLPC